MKLLLITILVSAFLFSGCSTVRDVKMSTYTFKKDRVDQRMEGNRGYLVGTPPPGPVESGTKKRTLIGIDVEIPILPGEEERIAPIRNIVPKEGEEAKELTNFSPRRAYTPQGSEEAREDEWIK